MNTLVSRGLNLAKHSAQKTCFRWWAKKLTRELSASRLQMTYSKLNQTYKHLQSTSVYLSKYYLSTVPKSETKKKPHPYQLLRETIRIEQDYLNKESVDFKAIASVCEQNSIHIRIWQNFCMDYFYRTGDVKNGQAFIEYLEKTDPSFKNMSLLAMLMGLLGKSGPKYQDLVYETYSKMERISDVMHLSLIKYIVQGFCGTEKWRKSLEFLEMEKLQNNTISAAIRGPIIVKAFQMEDVTLAENLLQELSDGKVEPKQSMFSEMIKLAKSGNSSFQIETFINLLKEKRWYPDENTAKELSEFFLSSKEEKWACEETSIDHSAKCPVCNFVLPVAQFSRSDFEGLKKDIMENLIITSNIYLNTNPEELEKFRKFLETEGQIDVIIDGLNIGLCQCYLDSAYKLRLAVEYFTNQNLKVLVIGRKHMKKWTKRQMDLINKKASIFNLENISQDDPFLLYAACSSGENALILTQDLLRNHGTRISGEYQPLYYKWLQCRQISEYYFHGRNLKLQIPSGYEVEPVKSKNGWHIPFQTSTGFQWLCLQRRN